ALTGCGYLAAAGAGGVLGVQGGSSRKVVFASNADLVLARGPFDPGDSLEGKGAAGLVIAQFRFNATNATTLEALTLTASGTGDDALLTNVRLVLDDDGDGQVDVGEPELAPAGTFAADDGELRLDDL